MRFAGDIGPHTAICLRAWRRAAGGGGPYGGKRQRVGDSGVFYIIGNGLGRTGSSAPTGLSVPFTIQPALAMVVTALAGHAGPALRGYRCRLQPTGGAFQPNFSSAFFRAAAMTWSMS